MTYVKPTPALLFASVDIISQRNMLDEECITDSVIILGYRYVSSIREC